jgi:hypothetical protein
MMIEIKKNVAESSSPLEMGRFFKYRISSAMFSFNKQNKGMCGKDVYIAVPKPVYDVVVKFLPYECGRQMDANDINNYFGGKLIPGYENKIVVYWENYQYTLNESFKFEVDLSGDVVHNVFDDL